MKRLLPALLGIALLSGQAMAGEKVSLKTQKDRVSYSIGQSIGNNVKNDLKSQSIDVNPDALAAGIRDAVAGSRARMTEKEMQETLAIFQQESMAKQMEMMKKSGGKNKKEGDAFLAANKKKTGVKTLASGLQYKVEKEGTGRKPKATDTVTVNYKGTLIDGTEFDSSYKHGQPATFPVNGVIAGWTEALQLMKVGSKWQLFIPSNLAYGEQGSPPSIGSNSTLIFEVELLSIK